MSSGIGTISKGLVQRAIERVINNEQLRPVFLDTLKEVPEASEADWVDFLREFGGLDTASERYFRRHWLGQSWSDDYPVETIVRQSLIEAIELADRLTTDAAHPMPIDCYWLYTEDTSKFEALITANERQVTRIILTPPPPTAAIDPSRLTEFAPLYIVKPGTSERQPEEHTLRQDPEGQWVTVQLKTPE